jgi:hypothetical protein
MQATTYYEFERPINWKGENVDMDTYDGELDYFELEVEGDVCIEIDNNYGADRDGNRGCRMDFSYVEDITVILDGDFRTFARKVRDFFRATLTGKKWTDFKDNAQFRFKGLGDEILSSGEQESIEESLFEAVENYEPDYDPRDDWH